MQDVCMLAMTYPNVSIHTVTDYDDCSSKPCMNGATCHDGVDSYTCQCQSGYSGSTCDIGKRMLRYLYTYLKIVLLIYFIDRIFGIC